MLDATQRRLWQLFTAPEGVGALLREEGDPEGRTLDGWIASDAALGAVSRLEVYANAYFSRLAGVLADDFGALAAALGEAAMNDVLTAYLLHCPPRRPSIRPAGDRLAEFLTAHPAALPCRNRWPWCADLARLEQALADAFDAADAPPLAREALAALPPAEWPALRLRLAPCVRVLRLAWPVLPLREAYERDAPLPAPPSEPARNTLLVWRREEQVRWRSIEALEAELLEMTQAGECFETLCAAAAREVGNAAAPAHAAALLGLWVESGLLAT